MQKPLSKQTALCRLVFDTRAFLCPFLIPGLPCRVLAKLSSGGKAKQALFSAAMAETTRVRNAGGDPATVPIWNKLVFSKVRGLVAQRCPFASAALCGNQTAHVLLLDDIRQDDTGKSLPELLKIVGDTISQLKSTFNEMTWCKWLEI